MATFTRKQQNKDNKAVKTTQSTLSPTIHMNAHQSRSQHQAKQSTQTPEQLTNSRRPSISEQLPSPQQQPQQAEAQSAGEIHLLFPPKLQSTDPSPTFWKFFGKAVKQTTLFERLACQVARMGYGLRSRWSR